MPINQVLEQEYKKIPLSLRKIIKGISRKIYTSYVQIVSNYLNPKKGVDEMGLSASHKLFSENRNKFEIEYNGNIYELIPIKTRMVTIDDDLGRLIEEYILQNYTKGDTLAISENLVAITQNRAIPIDTIRPSFFARTLYPWVSNVTYGTGLRSPQSMQVAIEEAGLRKILYASVICGINKILKRKRGIFYEITGPEIKSIDTRSSTIPVFGNGRPYVVLGPKDPNKVCEEIYIKYNIPSCIVDVNEVLSEVLGSSHSGLSHNALSYILNGNPFGQSTELTPFCIIRAKNKVL